MIKRYRFVGSGSGVPGLPYEVTEDEATEIGMSDVLKAAIANGNYEPVTDRTVATETAEPRKVTKQPKE